MGVFPPPDDGVYRYKDRQGNDHVIPAGIDSGWDYAPGASRTTPLKDLIDQKLIKFPAELGAVMWEALRPALAMEARLQWSAVLDEWLATPQQGRTQVIGALSPEILRWLDEHRQAMPQTAEIAIREGLIRGTKQARHERSGDGLTEMEWRELPRILREPDAVLFDNGTGKLIYLLATPDSGVKLSVEFDYRVGKSKMNMIVSGYRQSTAQIEERIKRGDWARIE